ncbi:VanZ family protein [Agrococcus carbonis]|uniref:VanZ like family protein n=1 Tax=Agrococcus carbonis TaxID=684552 RepID=A0A1H1KT39_9MICO|nr:VanZ family protein [Agrococcus carbonis]SDR65192.1 VanZ like family protein [Agrococcus carbonis]
MLSTYLAAYVWLAPAILAAEAIVGLLLAWMLASRPRVAWALAAVALVAVVAATLYPTGRALEVGCTFELELQVFAPEPLANVALFVLPTLFVAVAKQSPAWGAATGVALSAAIEMVQAFVPEIGRSCAVDDWVANSIGAVLGALLAAFALLLRRRRAERQADAQIAAATHR